MTLPDTMHPEFVHAREVAVALERISAGEDVAQVERDYGFPAGMLEGATNLRASLASVPAPPPPSTAAEEPRDLSTQHQPQQGGSDGAETQHREDRAVPAARVAKRAAQERAEPGDHHGGSGGGGRGGGGPLRVQPERPVTGISLDALRPGGGTGDVALAAEGVSQAPGVEAVRADASAPRADAADGERCVCGHAMADHIGMKHGDPRCWREGADGNFCPCPALRAVGSDGGGR